MLSSSNNDIQEKKIQKPIHSLSSTGPSVSMEMPLAKAYLKVSHIMEWVKSLNSFDIHSTALVQYGQGLILILKNILIITLIKILFGGLQSRAEILDDDTLTAA